MSQSPIAKGLHLTTQQHHTIPYNTSSLVEYDCRRTHGIFRAMYTGETSAWSDGYCGPVARFAAHNRYLVPGLSFEGGIFKEQQTTFI